MSKKDQEVIVINRARFAEIDMDLMSNLRKRVQAVFSSIPGFVSNTVWERVDDPFSFLTIGHFRSEDDSLKAWDMIVRSPVMEVIGDLLSEPQNNQRFFLRGSAGIKLEDTKPGQFCSVSARISDMGYSENVLTELHLIFQELQSIPGFLGYVTGQQTEIEDEVLGLAFWDSRQSFELSIPKKTMYEIDLYSRVL